ncbi:DUF6456 domain-containing protein [Altericroceibacterium endophyticum]|uniref:DUF6456 domain-containing protein n=1 Tax=Altericroceibacterium endophyticum TaxID=1808508 RepID=A0A6I4T038_9SPHN|nr:DUF6456 domain-containing protein [Altericroceibacterium endophyticum]MXO64318.1 hypothetical protein [Altericroceibacterium endophyticum]
MKQQKQVLAEREIGSEGPRKGTGVHRRQRSVTVNLAESPASWLHARGHLDDRLFQAAELLRMDYEKAQLSPSLTMRWDPVRVREGQAPLNSTERQIAAKDRFHGAMEQAGKGLADILWRVVCAGEALPGVEKQFSWPARSGKLILKFALERVADFYRVPG